MCSLTTECGTVRGGVIDRSKEFATLIQHIQKIQTNNTKKRVLPGIRGGVIERSKEHAALIKQVNEHVIRVAAVARGT